jgi:drug/metabolite transporter (DMT)-like permease
MPAVVAAPIVSTPSGAAPVARASAPATVSPPQVMLALLAVYVIWGSTYLVMRWAVSELPPMLMGGIRFSVAGGILYAIARLRGAPAPSLRHWINGFAVGGLLFVGGNGFVAIAERSVSSGVAAVVCATMPLWLALMAWGGGERPTGREWIGQLLGLGGVAVLVGDQLGTAAPLDTIVIVLAPISWAAGSMLSKRIAIAPGMMGAATEMIGGSVLMALVGLSLGERIHAVSWEAIGSMAYLIGLGSLVGFTAYAWLLQHTRPAVATSYAFVNPPIAVGFGILLGGEAAGWPLAVATPLIVASVVLVVLAKAKRAPAPSSS